MKSGVKTSPCAVIGAARTGGDREAVEGGVVAVLEPVPSIYSVRLVNIDFRPA